MNSNVPARWLHRLPAALLLVLSGCSLFPQPGIEPVATDAAPELVVAEPPPPARIAILYSDAVDRFGQIAVEITSRDSANIYDRFVLPDGKLPAATRAQIDAFAPDKLVAIGLSAAQASAKFGNTPTVFCQVFNHQQHDLLSRHVKGVNLLPPFELQLAEWQAVSPGLRSVGVVTSPDQRELLAEIEAAAERRGVRLLARTASSDRELLQVFKRLTPDIQGFWLLPDNRLLSPVVLKEIFAYSRKHGTETVVFDARLLDFGANISFNSRPGDVADAVLQVLGGPGSNDVLFGPPMTPLAVLQMQLAEPAPQSRTANRALAD